MTHIWFKSCFHIQKRSLERGSIELHTASYNVQSGPRYYIMPYVPNMPFGQKTISFGQNDPNRLYGLAKLLFSTINGPFWGLFEASVTHIWFKSCFHVPKRLLERSNQLT